MFRTIVLLFILLIQTQSKLTYEIVGSEKDNRGLVNQLYIYVPKMADVRAVNSEVWGKFKKTNIASFQIYYFDNKKIAVSYKRLIFNKNISDAELDRVSSHVIGKFSMVLGKEDLHIGKEADMY
ncbi:MAG: hypothetical protein ACTHNW_11265 [Mucilaginibacter sp.]